MKNYYDLLKSKSWKLLETVFSLLRQEPLKQGSYLPKEVRRLRLKKGSFLHSCATRKLKNNGPFIQLYTDLHIQTARHNKALPPNLIKPDWRVHDNSSFIDWSNKDKAKALTDRTFAIATTGNNIKLRASFAISPQQF